MGRVEIERRERERHRDGEVLRSRARYSREVRLNMMFGDDDDDDDDDESAGPREREILEIFRDDDNHDHAAAAALHNSHKNTRTKHTQQTLFFSTRAKTLAFSLRR